jgi:hypothetical protein
MENNVLLTGLSKVLDFQKDLKEVKDKLTELVLQYGINDGVYINVENGTVKVSIDVEEFR